MLQVDLLIVLQVGRGREGVGQRRGSGDGRREERLMGRQDNWKEYEVGRKMLERKDEKGWDRIKDSGTLFKEQ